MINAIALSQIRTQRGLSQRKFARLVGLNYQVIRRLELGGDDGNLTLREFARICMALDADPADLMNARKRSIFDGPPAATGPEEMDLSQARLLRRIQEGCDIRSSISSQDRQTILPQLMKLGLVQTSAGGRLHLSSESSLNLGHPEGLAS
ncbi:helix-turn-helix domain-containing protein [Oryzihumus leptocrescens]|uniref:DNA-binding Xre family transcriptional regulator n=1 Tax=Oryzihumus leptocrescens TaxID=297536 RepID=A0A542ZKU6_9MICO|nr:helix-turn-helix transcriptional regulator [Oryzihumus leptocrescens]TQL60982.1 DNA-binding Xre family transcriptional regulator [Oryzihumus leptocrescens]